MRKRYRRRRNPVNPWISRYTRRGGTVKRHFRKPPRKRRRYRRNPGPVILAGFGNPVRRRRYRRSPARRRYSTRAYRRRSYRRNPAGALSVRGITRAFSRQNLMNVGGTAAGLVLGIKATKFIVQPEFMQKIRKFAGAVHIAAGFVIATMVRQPLAKSAGLGFAAAGAYDLLSQNFGAQLGLSPMSGVDLEDVGADLEQGQEGQDVVDLEQGADVGELEIAGDDDEYAF